MNAFVFYDITIKEQAKKKIIQSNSKRRWLSIEKMRQNKDAISTNKDVIDLLEIFPRPKDSFVNLLGDFKIIWNITSKCPYKCAICATYSENRNELDANGKLRVLNSICTAKNYIKNVDFAGGDPLSFDENTTIIQSAIAQLGKDKVSITTTGRGVLAVEEDKFLGVARHCEITIDAAHDNLQISPAGSFGTSYLSREENEYSTHNIEQIKLISTHADSLTINIPIINDDLSDTEINNLVEKIQWIKEHTAGIEIDASLIRLMPVGKTPRVLSKDKYKLYNPIPVAQRIKQRLEELNISCKLHCSLRVLPQFNTDISSDHCSMLENKLGIDCEGNVFACAWGGYIESAKPPTQNPFYLGNLTKHRLIDIVEGVSKTNQYIKILNEIDNKKYRDFCSVVSYYISKEMFQNNDPLSEHTTLPDGSQ